MTRWLEFPLGSILSISARNNNNNNTVNFTSDYVPLVGDVCGPGLSIKTLASPWFRTHASSQWPSTKALQLWPKKSQYLSPILLWLSSNSNVAKHTFSSPTYVDSWNGPRDIPLWAFISQRWWWPCLCFYWVICSTTGGGASWGLIFAVLDLASSSSHKYVRSTLHLTYHYLNA